MKTLLNNLKIGKRLILSFLLVSVCTSIASIFGLVKLIDADRQYSDALVYYGFAQGDVGNLLAELNYSASLVKDSIILEDSQQISRIQANLSESNARIDQYLNAVHNSLSDVREEQDLYQSIADALPLYQEKCSQVMNLGTSN